MLRVIQPHDTFTVIMQNKKSLILGGILIVLAIIFFQTVLNNKNETLSYEEKQFLNQQNTPQDYDQTLFN